MKAGKAPYYSIAKLRPLKNTLFVIASEAKQSHNKLIIKEIATAHTRLAMTGNEFFKGLKLLKLKWRKCMGIEPTWDGFSAPHRI